VQPQRLKSLLERRTVVALEVAGDVVPALTVFELRLELGLTQFDWLQSVEHVDLEVV